MFVDVVTGLASNALLIFMIKLEYNARCHWLKERAPPE